MMLFIGQYHLLLLASINRSLNIWRLSVAVPWVLICFVSIRNIGGCVERVHNLSLVFVIFSAFVLL